MGITANIIHIRLIFALMVIITCAAHPAHAQGYFRCAKYGQNIMNWHRCDGNNDCADGSDETVETCGANCEKVEGRFACSNGQCLWADLKCDGDNDCADGSDETTETCGDNCGGASFRCANGQCVSAFRKCDGRRNCRDGSDETTEACSAKCIEGGGWACSDGQCIPAEQKCSGSRNCRDGSDETTATCGANCEEVKGGPFPSNVRIFFPNEH